jgi:hypothetical protein
MTTEDTVHTSKSRHSDSAQLLPATFDTTISETVDIFARLPVPHSASPLDLPSTRFRADRLAFRD